MSASRQPSAPEMALSHVLALLEIEAPAGAQERLLTYAAEIVRWNQQTNLTASKDVLGFVEGPLFDALTLVPLLQGGGHLVDVGSGGGLPGIPAALLRPGLTVTLVEPRKKRAAFLRHAVQVLGLPCAVREDKEAGLPGGAYDHAVAEAVFPPQEWALRGPRLVRDGGFVYVLSSTLLSSAALPAGVVIEEQLSYTRPKDGRPRYAIRLRRAA